VSLLIAVLLLTTCKFSVNYLHREPGYVRFFLLMLCSARACSCWCWRAASS
jgi:NADH:ubiquinone oxidoreductase subunit 5 (subunit L)/multisubunit Na+/H+ antiporter MnhA subunit